MNDDQVNAPQASIKANRISLACRLLGHTGTFTESGYHVCSRCGLHEYHCFEAYQKAGFLLQPWWWMKCFIKETIENMRSYWQRWTDQTDDVPF